MEPRETGERWQRLLALLDPIHRQAVTSARRLGRSAADGDDLYQEAVLRAFHKLHTLRAPVDGQGFSVKVMKMKTHAGATTLKVEVRDDGRTATAEVQSAETMGDAAVAASIESQLRQAGIQAHVTVAGDQVTVEKEK